MDEQTKFDDIVLNDETKIDDLEHAEFDTPAPNNKTKIEIMERELDESRIGICEVITMKCLDSFILCLRFCCVDK